MYYLHQTEWRANQPEIDLPPHPINVNVRRRGFDPFFSGIAVGAFATLLGVVLGLYFFLPV